MINDKEFKEAHRQGFNAAVKAHAGVVAAAERVVNVHMDADEDHRELAGSIRTLASALNNLKTTLEGS